MRNVLERSSARETTVRVAAGAAAKKLLSLLGIEVALLPLLASMHSKESNSDWGLRLLASLEARSMTRLPGIVKMAIPGKLIALEDLKAV
ncbi:Chorismate synthase [Mycobacteroides abscessus subsp. abscessus]|nr:Chorismate synthase [Mycobacteroides abscessus subsp. abscessus]